MTRSDLIRILTEEQENIPVGVLEQSVKHMFDLMAKSLGRGERIEIRGFGSFSLRYRAPRTARNPRTGETLTTESKYAIHFKPGKDLKDRVNTA